MAPVMFMASQAMPESLRHRPGCAQDLLACRLRSFNAMQILKLLPCQGLIDSGHPVSKLRMPLPRVVIEERIVRNVNRRHWMVSTVLLADQRLQGDRRLTILG